MWQFHLHDWSFVVFLGIAVGSLFLYSLKQQRDCLLRGQQVQARLVRWVGRASGDRKVWFYTYTFKGVEHGFRETFSNTLKEGDEVTMLVDPMKPYVSCLIPADIERTLQQIRIGFVGLSCVILVALWALLFT